MQSLVKKAKNHLSRNNMNYTEHFVFAFSYGILCIKAGIYLCTHSILPCFFEKEGSKLVHKMEKVFVEREEIINNESESSAKEKQNR